MLREKFVKDFDETTAKAIEAAAKDHVVSYSPVRDLCEAITKIIKPELDDEHKTLDTDITKEGDDPFVRDLVLAIAFQCFEIKSYRKEHGIVPPYEEIKQWIKDNVDFNAYNGGYDYLSLAVGAYDDYLDSDAVKRLLKNVGGAMNLMEGTKPDDATD